ncbi:GH1 family beta-glucosidase [Rhodocytophaga aerolata]|uniref:Beta-glucosidase n=1 Tax=Rhodocytophaga aerolata TaxID=455078 RepID=A0ABT8QZZ3_9BACT|nr:GH1 family beta-glucosidase [Rhodocytophaga aerolata]MDO1444714.1 GH1 family beta-glucosidase [Rhodocytophaga aerolata]
MIDRTQGSAEPIPESILHKKQFGTDFIWGVSTAAYQVEGAYQTDGKGLSIWDVFSNKKGNTYLNQHGNTACNFYHCYQDDLQLMRALHIANFRFSIAWSRIMPGGVHPVNPKGIDFYQYLIDHCLELGIEPWVTLYHWDLPQALELKGGWTNRDVVNWFSEYVEVCIKHFGDRVKHWMVLNEPMVFTGAGHFLGIHAPGRRWMKNFIPAVHHATLCQAAGARILKEWQPKAQVGTTFSASYIEPHRNTEKDQNAAIRIDALLNRLFLEPALGLGYPVKELPFLQRIEKYMKPGDEKLLSFDFDFIGLQVYTREIVSHTWLMPFIQADLVKATKRSVPTTVMNWEVYPESIYQMLKQYARYGLKKIIVTENGAAFTDVVQGGQVHDKQRLNYLQDHIRQVLWAKQEGVPVDGYFVWTFTDNFEWAMGYHPRFGLVYVDFPTQQRIIKSSGYWYRDFLKS